MGESRVVPMDADGYKTRRRLAVAQIVHFYWGVYEVNIFGGTATVELVLGMAGIRS